MDKRELEKRVSLLNDIQQWNHNFILPFGVETSPGDQISHGKNFVKWKRIQSLVQIINVENKAVLDVGCNEGFFSFQLADLGARVLGIDVDENRIKKAMFIQDILKRPLVTFALIDLYSESFLTLPHFDICLCLGVLHRIPDPYTAIAKIAEHSDIIIFEWKSLKFGPHDEPFAYYTSGKYNEKDYYGTQYWLMSFACIEAILLRLGYDHFHRIDDPQFRRAILVAGKKHNPIFDLPDIILHRGRIRTLLSHTKRYVLTVGKILSGRINA
jgi:SAM-dependent methyltransferase